MTFLLQFTNVDALMRSFPTQQEAISEGRRAGFEFSVWATEPGHPMFQVASWTVFGGLRQN